METKSCTLVSEGNFRVYYIFDRVLNGYMILDLPAQNNDVFTWIKTLRKVLNTLDNNYPIYFITDDVSWIKNHCKIYGNINGKTVYQYINHYDKAK